jgi:NNP family nitrate/nitrite transporter-like MFS transporter
VLEVAPENQSPDRWRVLTLSSIAFTLMFAAWLMLGVLGLPIRKSMGLSDAQFDWLLAAAILAGALPRLMFGIWADAFGGRTVYLALLLFCAVPAYLLSHATSYPQLVVCALLLGLAGNAFTAGISWNSAWFPPDSRGFALGVFGAGNVGAAGTKLLVILIPGLLTFVRPEGYLNGLIPGGWRFVPALYAVLLVLMAVAIAVGTPSNDRKPGQGRTFEQVFGPLQDVRVWRFSLYYVVVFGAYVALSAWLPKFYTDTYGLSLRDASLLTAVFIFPASLLRPLGGWLSDRHGPRGVTYAIFLAMSVALAILSLPNGTYFGWSYHPSAGVFTALLFVVACAMGIGKGSVFKYVPDYYPDDVGAVGGLVGALGALGGFLLPPVFGWLGRATGAPRLAFASILVLTVVSLVWLHLVVLSIRATQKREVALVEVVPVT